MAFKLNSPFYVAKVNGGLGPGGLNSKTQSRSTTPKFGVFGKFLDTDSNTEGEEENKIEEPSNETTKNLVEKSEKGVPLGLNPKQEARRAVKEFRKSGKDKAKLDRQTEKAKKIYKRNEFEAIGKDGAYVDPDKAASIKSDRAEKELEQNQMQKILKSNLPLAEREQQINDIRSKSKFYNDKILSDKEEKSLPKNNLVMRNKEEEFKNPLLQMKGKPNRAGCPVRMLKSMEDTTPAKYKSVKKAGRENLMTALAKKGETVEGDFTHKLGSHYDKKDFGTGDISIKNGKSKSNKINKNPKPSSHETRHTSVKF